VRAVPLSGARTQKGQPTAIQDNALEFGQLPDDHVILLDEMRRC
jgi:hypothetical protein